MNGKIYIHLEQLLLICCSGRSSFLNQLQNFPGDQILLLDMVLRKLAQKVRQSM